MAATKSTGDGMRDAVRSDAPQAAAAVGAQAAGDQSSPLSGAAPRSCETSPDGAADQLEATRAASGAASPPSPPALAVAAPVATHETRQPVLRLSLPRLQSVPFAHALAVIEDPRLLQRTQAQLGAFADMAQQHGLGALLPTRTIGQSAAQDLHAAYLTAAERIIEGPVVDAAKDWVHAYALLRSGHEQDVDAPTCARLLRDFYRAWSTFLDVVVQTGMLDAVRNAAIPTKRDLRNMMASFAGLCERLERPTLYMDEESQAKRREWVAARDALQECMVANFGEKGHDAIADVYYAKRPPYTPSAPELLAHRCAVDPNFRVKAVASTDAGRALARTYWERYRAKMAHVHDAPAEALATTANKLILLGERCAEYIKKHAMFSCIAKQRMLAQLSDALPMERLRANPGDLTLAEAMEAVAKCSDLIMGMVAMLEPHFPPMSGAHLEMAAINDAVRALQHRAAAGDTPPNVILPDALELFFTSLHQLMVTHKNQTIALDTRRTAWDERFDPTYYGAMTPEPNAEREGVFYGLVAPILYQKPFEELDEKQRRRLTAFYACRPVVGASPAVIEPLFKLLVSPLPLSDTVLPVGFAYATADLCETQQRFRSFLSAVDPFTGASLITADALRACLVHWARWYDGMADPPVLVAKLLEQGHEALAREVVVSVGALVALLRPNVRDRAISVERKAMQAGALTGLVSWMSRLVNDPTAYGLRADHVYGPWAMHHVVSAGLVHMLQRMPAGVGEDLFPETLALDRESLREQQIEFLRVVLEQLNPALLQIRDRVLRKMAAAGGAADAPPDPTILESAMAHCAAEWDPQNAHGVELGQHVWNWFYAALCQYAPMGADGITRMPLPLTQDGAEARAVMSILNPALNQLQVSVAGAVLRDMRSAFDPDMRDHMRAAHRPMESTPAIRALVEQLRMTASYTLLTHGMHYAECTKRTNMRMSVVKDMLKQRTLPETQSELPLPIPMEAQLQPAQWAALQAVHGQCTALARSLAERFVAPQDVAVEGRVEDTVPVSGVRQQMADYLAKYVGYLGVPAVMGPCPAEPVIPIPALLLPDGADAERATDVLHRLHALAQQLVPVLCDEEALDLAMAAGAESTSAASAMAHRHRSGISGAELAAAQMRLRTGKHV